MPSLIPHPDTLPAAVLRLTPLGERVYANAAGRELFDALAPAWQPIVARVAGTGEAEAHEQRAGERVVVCRFARAADGPYVDVVGQSVALALLSNGNTPTELELQQLNAELAHRIGEHGAELENANRARAAERAQLAQRVAERTADLSAANAELARGARAKDEFLASISHELRTPLNTILGMTEALQEGVFGHLFDEQREALRNIEESGRHLLEMINDLLDLSKMEAGKMALQPGAVNVESLCAAARRLVDQAVQTKGQRLVTYLDPAVSEINADARRLRQILVNLLTNAVKFTPEGGSLGLEVMGDPEGETVRFVVWDSGIGISPVDAGRLFKPFAQLDTGLSRQYSGTGLGLMLVYRMAELHGGSITLESQPEHGSRFTIALPWSGPSSGVATARAAAPGLQEIAHVLVIEDSSDAIQQVTSLLNETGVRVSTHMRFDGALSKVLELSPDVILLDTMLPDGSGWDLLGDLKTDSRLAAIPVVMMSASDEHVLAVDAGAVACLIKPVTRETLRAGLSRVVGARLVDTDPSVETLPAVAADAPLGLVADDNEHVLFALSKQLRMDGYRVAVARNGTEVVERAREERPELILLDQQMPGPEGADIVQQIRADSRLATIPILALSALVKPGDRERVLAAGANDYFAKPLAGQKLMQALETAIAGGGGRRKITR